MCLPCLCNQPRGNHGPARTAPVGRRGELTLARWWRAAFSRSSAATSSIWSPRTGPRVQPMRGFDPIYTDIVDYIVRCTHRIWDERDVGLIYTHYTHNSVVYLTTRTLYNREDVVRDTIQRLVSLPERRGMATQVIWSRQRRGRLLHLAPRHRLGPAHPGRPLRAADRADLRLADDRRLHDLREQDLPRVDRRRHDGDPPAARARPAPVRRAAGARACSTRGCSRSTSARTAGCSASIRPRPSRTSRSPRNDIERETLRWLHEVFNQRMFGKIKDVYAPTVHVPRAADDASSTGSRR